MDVDKIVTSQQIANGDVNFKYAINLPENLASTLVQLDKVTSKREVNNDDSTYDKKIDFLTNGRDISVCPYMIDKSLHTKFELNLLYNGDDSNRPGKKFKTTNPFIVVHEVFLLQGKEDASRNLEFYKNMIKTANIIGIINPGFVYTGYHFLCDDDKIVCFIPWDEIAYHCGTKINEFSIGIERLVHEGVSFPDALHNQAKLIATLMYMENIPLRRVITHYDATLARGLANPKKCPSRMLSGEYGGTVAFYADIIYCLRHRDLFLDELADVKSEISASKKDNLSKVEMVEDYIKNNNIDPKLLSILELFLTRGKIDDEIKMLLENYYSVSRKAEEKNFNAMLQNEPEIKHK